MLAPALTWPRGVTVSTLDSESSDRGSNPREAFAPGPAEPSFHPASFVYWCHARMWTPQRSRFSSARSLCSRPGCGSASWQWASLPRSSSLRPVFNRHTQYITWPRGVTVSTLDSESSDRGSNPREALTPDPQRAGLIDPRCLPRPACDRSPLTNASWQEIRFCSLGLVV